MIVLTAQQKQQTVMLVAGIASRTTMREEDAAGCLTGTFAVHMLILYGEGRGAFRTFQEKFQKASDGHSLFAWKRDYDDRHLSLVGCGLLADSPKAFRHPCDIYAKVDGPERRPCSMSNIELVIDLC